ncbi:MAG: glycoside hydrolase [Pedobacter sp.]|nr:MAG: glycoside hydrolase [Pedobacter sp.]
MKNHIKLVGLIAIAFSTSLAKSQEKIIVSKGNPIITDKYTADPAALVYKDSVYLYTGHDVPKPPKNNYEMHEWLVYSSADMVTWKEHKSPLDVKAFTWAKDDAWASQVIERDGKFYWYVAIEHGTIKGKSIGIAVSDSPTGPFKDALGKAFITNDMTTDVKISWDDIDPSVIIDDDGQAFTEAPWIHKRKDWYYLSYASQFPEKIVYAMSKKVTGPWEYKGILNEIAGNSNTNHQAIINFKGKDYFVYHNGAINNDGGSYRRSVCIDYLYYNKDGTMKRVVMTTEGIKKAN